MTQQSAEKLPKELSFIWDDDEEDDVPATNLNSEQAHNSCPIPVIVQRFLKICAGTNNQSIKF
jgi:hypothetical protein